MGSQYWPMVTRGRIACLLHPHFPCIMHPSLPSGYASLLPSQFRFSPSVVCQAHNRVVWMEAHSRDGLASRLHAVHLLAQLG